MSYFVERWVRATPERTLADIADFLGGTVYAGLSLEQKVAVLVSIADGLEWAGLHEQARTMNSLARGVFPPPTTDESGEPSAPENAPKLPHPWPYAHVAETNAWIQAGVFHLAEHQRQVAADALRAALAIAPRNDAAFLLEAATAQPGE